MNKEPSKTAKVRSLLGTIKVLVDKTDELLAEIDQEQAQKNVEDIKTTNNPKTRTYEPIDEVRKKRRTIGSLSEMIIPHGFIKGVPQQPYPKTGESVAEKVK